MAAFRFTITDHQAMMAAARRAMHKTRDQSGLLEKAVKGRCTSWTIIHGAGCSGLFAQ